MKPLGALQSEHVLAIWRAPFAPGRPLVTPLAPGMTIAEIIDGMDCLPPDFAKRGTVTIGGHELARRHWRRIRPKAGQRLAFHYALAGGDEGAGKAILGIIVAIATVLTAGLAAAGQFAVGGWFAFGSTSAKLLSMGISLVGSLAAAAISAPPAAKKKASEDQNEPASLTGNVLAAGAPIPRVIGTRRIYPALACQPLTWREGKEELVEGIFVLAGPHRIEDIRIGETSIADAEDVELQIREGWPDDNPIELVNRYGVTRTPSIELSSHRVEGDDQRLLDDQENPARSLPKWHAAGTSADADEIWLHLVLPEGMTRGSAPDQKQTLPIRLRLRAGETDPWINLPEIHFTTAESSELRLDVLIKWGEPTIETGVPANDGWTAAFKATPGQESPATEAWAAHASFSAGSGDDAYHVGTASTSNVLRVRLSQLQAQFFLDPAVIAKGAAYQIEVKRGSSFVANSFNKDTYVYAGDVIDFFGYIVDGGQAKVIRTRENLADRAYLLRTVSVWNRHPVAGGTAGPGLALIAVRARGRQLESLSCTASGYVPDFDGTSWSDWTVTSCPAPHYRDVLRGALTPDPLPEELVDNESLIEWRQACVDAGHAVDLVCEGASIDEVLTKIAGCGYARPAQSEVWGVMRDYDRSAEEPSQIFTARNSASPSMFKAFPRLPDAFRVVWKSASDLDGDRSMLVWRKGREGTLNPRVEEVRYEGIVDEAKVRARAEFDLSQGMLRAASWTWKAPAEAIRCRRGDLVGLNHDVMDRVHASARIEDVEIVGGNVVAAWLDQDVAIVNEPDLRSVADVRSVADMRAVGETTAMAVRRADGSRSQHTIAGVSGRRRRIEFTVPVPAVEGPDDEPAIQPDCLVWLGRPGKLAARLIVTSVRYDKKLSATISAVPEAPELFAA